jgi:hypothetical protein
VAIKYVRGIRVAKSTTKEVYEVGPVLFERSKRAKNLNISVEPLKGVRVAVPRSLSFEEARKIVQSKVGWIKKHLARMKEMEEKYTFIRRNSVDIDRAKATRRLISRLNELADGHDFTYHRVFIRNQKTLWGSCSTRNNINLNVKLVQLPDKLIDYVILHELLHTRIKNHRKDFWRRLDRLVGDAKHMDSRLNKYQLGLL